MCESECSVCGLPCVIFWQRCCCRWCGVGCCFGGNAKLMAISWMQSVWKVNSIWSRSEISKDIVCIYVKADKLDTAIQTTFTFALETLLLLLLRRRLLLNSRNRHTRAWTVTPTMWEYALRWCQDGRYILAKLNLRWWKFHRSNQPNQPNNYLNKYFLAAWHIRPKSQGNFGENILFGIEHQRQHYHTCTAFKWENTGWWTHRSNSIIFIIMYI